MRQIFIAIAGCFICFSLHSQNSQCSGNLGENIFVTGDFGRGTANILPVDPGIAPGFQYSTFVPFHDGRYTITNDMALWPDIWPAWLLIGDNSTDPQGYMMVVNASFTPGIFYEQTIDGLCDNTLYEFSADVINIVRANVGGHIFPNVSFLIDGVEEFTTGPIPQSELWKTFGFTFTTATDQEEVTLTLRNNAPGGTGNDLALDNISFRPCGPSATIAIDMMGRVCENALYPTLSAIVASDTGYVQWQISDDLGNSWSDIAGATARTYQSVQLSAQLYLFRYLYGNSPQHLQNEKCRIVSASNSIEVVPVHFTIIDTLCEGLNFDLGGVLYNSSGIYFEHLTAANGCDSLVTLELTIVSDPGIEAELMILPPSCAGLSDGQISITAINGGVVPYVFSIDGQAPLSSDLAIPVTAGLYEVVVSDRYGCTDIHNFEIVDPLPFVIQVSGENSIILGHSTTLNVSGNYLISSIEWKPVGSLDCSTRPSTEAMPLFNTHYIATAISEEGCPASDSLFILVDTDPRVYIPNVFSPNGDNVNDTWGVYADPLNVKAIAHLVVFDRWGGIMHDAFDIPSLDAQDIWDGRNENGLAGTGVYVYLLELRMANDEIVKKSGSVTVVR